MLLLWFASFRSDLFQVLNKARCPSFLTARPRARASGPLSALFCSTSQFAFKQSRHSRADVMRTNMQGRTNSKRGNFSSRQRSSMLAQHDPLYIILFRVAEKAFNHGPSSCHCQLTSFGQRVAKSNKFMIVGCHCSVPIEPVHIS